MIKKVKYWIIVSLLIASSVWYLVFALPKPLFDKPTSTIIESSEGILLGGSIAADGQWRFPEIEKVPDKIALAVTHFEDEYFYWHPGFNPISLLRAARQNLKKGGIHSGGSTISMQTIRLASGNPARSYFEKLKELILATRLELGYSKEEILAMYVSNAPFGGNVVGIEAAAWRYYKRKPSELSWSEAATMAVLPNAPSLIYPGKNQSILLKKRNRLLYKLWQNNVIDESSYMLALEELLPQKPNALPQFAAHLLDLADKKSKGKKVITTVKNELQEHVNNVVSKHHNQLRLQEIHNLACIVVSIENGEILAYVGNANDPKNEHANRVDIIQSPRSSGSILKPFLYQKMLDEGYILPKTLLPDVPLKAFENYSRDYEGAVPADEALARSLNLPAVHMLRTFGVQKFKNVLENYGFQHFTQSSSHYGLSLIIGGGEITLMELAQAYANMARQLNYPKKNENDFLESTFIKNVQNVKHEVKFANTWATYQTLNALKEVVRPESEAGWQNFKSNSISWKTGTSHGFRDAWAVGINAKYVVAVWVGNADGEGRPNMTGTSVAAPVLFDVFEQLVSETGHNPSKEPTIPLKICKQSSYLWTEACPEFEIISVPSSNLKITSCPYHKEIFLDKTDQYQVNSSCYAINEMHKKKWFVLPPQMAWYYQKKHPTYLSPPPYLSDCNNFSTGFALIYPKDLSKIYVPINLGNEREKVIFEAVHAQKEAVLYWQMDNEYLTETHGIHKIEIAPTRGTHLLSITDQNGTSILNQFMVLN
jgi:penicillin-binding protein 1C